MGQKSSFGASRFDVVLFDAGLTMRLETSAMWSPRTIPMDRSLTAHCVRCKEQVLSLMWLHGAVKDMSKENSHAVYRLVKMTDLSFCTKQMKL